MRANKPTMHEDFQMETAVVVDETVYPGAITGTIIGIALMHVIFHYIVLLDVPIEVEGETFRGISVSGTLLKKI